MLNINWEFALSSIVVLAEWLKSLFSNFETGKIYDITESFSYGHMSSTDIRGSKSEIVQLSFSLMSCFLIISLQDDNIGCFSDIFIYFILNSHIYSYCY